MADVARLAGVSVSTVSYALSGTRPISVSTRKRIEQAMLDLGYTPNAFARGLKSKRSRIIAMLFPAQEDVLRLSSLDHLLGASDSAQQRGYHLMLCTTDVGALEELGQLAGQGLLDGALLMGVRLHDPRIKVLADAGVPFAMIGHNADPAGLDWAGIDFDQSAKLAVDHLAGQGHRRMGFVGGPAGAQDSGGGEATRLAEAFGEAARRAGAGLVVVPAEGSVDGGRAAFLRLLEADPDLTAVIAFNEPAVPGVMHAATALGRRIPLDLSVVSIDMPRQVAELMTPPMTTVGPSAAAIGHAAVSMLLRRLEGDTGPARQLLFRGELSLRGSCGPAPGAEQGASMETVTGARPHLQ